VRIRTVVTTGKAMHEAPFKLVGLRCPLPEPVPVQVAFAVPRRNLPRAVDRNRMKRLMREAWRRSRAQLPADGPSPGEQLALLFIYQGREVIAHPEVITKIDRLLRRWLEKHGG
jgi:ribonuclease P protein component